MPTYFHQAMNDCLLHFVNITAYVTVSSMSEVFVSVSVAGDICFESQHLGTAMAGRCCMSIINYFAVSP